MSLEQELYEEKRRKLRRSSFIKGCLVTAAIIAIGLVFWNKDFKSSPHIASYQVIGEIYDDPQRDAILNDIAENDHVYGLIVKINSPGGSVVGAEALYHSLRKVEARKPVVVLIGEVGASAAYIAALAGDVIYARGNSLVGSIRVIVQYPDLSQLAKNLGISLTVIKSSEAKGGTNFLKPIDKKSLQNQELLVRDSFIWFKQLVSDRRTLVGEDLENVSQGELFTGRMALELNLIDSIGSLDQAIEYLQSQGKKFDDIEIKDWNQNENPKSFWNALFGLSNLNYLRNKIKFMQTPMLFSIVS
jgi:protease-4